MKSGLIIISIIMLCIPAYGMMKLDSIFSAPQDKQNESESALKPYCGYSIVYPISSNWNGYSWLEKRNYQAFFQNILASYRFNATTVDGRILIYFSPQYVSNIKTIGNITDQLVMVQNRFAALGMGLRKTDMNVPYEIIVYILPLNISSNVIPLPGELISDSYKSTPVIVINGNKLDSILSNPCILSHAYAHAIIASMKEMKSFWFVESVSAWMETLINNKCDNIELFYKYRLKHPEISLGSSDANAAIGDANFIRLLNSKNDGIINRMLIDKEAYTDPLAKLNEQLIASTNKSISDYFEEYALSNFYEAWKSSSVPGNTLTTFPSLNNFTANQLSASYTKLSSSNNEAIRLLFEGEKKNLKIWMFMVEPPLKFYASSLAFTENKPLEFICPGDNSLQAYLVIINSSMNQDSISMLASIINDYPFKLASFEASSGNKQVALNWVTIRETDTLGWIIYRKDNKETEFRKINELLIPAVGNSIDPTHYVFIDKDVRPGTSYQYYLEVITKNSMPKKGPATSVKLP